MAPYSIRIVGDPVLAQPARDVDDIDGRLAKLVDDMFVTMYEAPGLGLAAPQVGVQKRLFVYDPGDDPKVLINPRVTGADGEWWFEEGCLSIPGAYFEICRPRRVEVTGLDLDGNEVVIEAEDLIGRILQHELDHLDGTLLLEHLDGEQLREAKRHVRELQLREDHAPREAGSGFRLR